LFNRWQPVKYTSSERTHILKFSGLHTNRNLHRKQLQTQVLHTN